MMWSETDQADLRKAVQLLENPSLAARLTSLLGQPIEGLIRTLPSGASKAISKATTIALEKALQASLYTLRNKSTESSNFLHKLMVTGSGAFGGAFGVAALAVELPISTCIMLRSIADIARSEGEDLADPTASMACIEVFALGARTETDDSTETGYFAIRALLAKSVAEAAEFIAGRAIIEEGAPLLVRFIAQVSSRFGIIVTQKFVAQAVPVVGAAGGALINLTFIDHFQDMARGHFIIRRLERQYGTPSVQAEYERFLGELPG